jgi:hypothetical protein
MMTEIEPDRERFVAGAVTMGLVTVLLFFVPLVNGIIGGMAGGIRVADAGRSIWAGFAAVAPVALALFLVLGLAGAPVLGVPTRPTTLMLIVMACIGILIGAPLGAYVGIDARSVRARRARSRHAAATFRTRRPTPV